MEKGVLTLASTHGCTGYEVVVRPVSYFGPQTPKAVVQSLHCCSHQGKGRNVELTDIVLAI